MTKYIKQQASTYQYHLPKIKKKIIQTSSPQNTAEEKHGSECQFH